MLKFANTLIMGSALAAVLLFFPLQRDALAEVEEVAPGITYEVLKEHDPSLIPGATKIIESIFIMQPGTSIDFPDGFPSANICTAMLGQVKVTMGDMTVVYRAGDQWTEPIDTPMALQNVGNVPYVDKTFEIYFE